MGIGNFFLKKKSSGKTYFGLLKIQDEILDKLKARDFNATSLSTYDFSTLYTTLPHNLIKDKSIDLIEELSREKALLTVDPSRGSPFGIMWLAE